MRLMSFIAALFLAVGPAVGQDWMEYTFPDFFFSVAFPTQPKIEITTYQASDGRSFEARIYSVTQDSGVFKVSVVELPNAGMDESALIGHAVKTLTDGGQIKLDIPHRIRRVYGRQLSITGADGSHSYVAVFLS
jgi:hypothetical protein